MQAKPKAVYPKSKKQKPESENQITAKISTKSNKVGPKEYTIFVLWVNNLVFRVCG
jgi:hypothetical protein